MYYGLTHKGQVQTIAQRVCDAFGSDALAKKLLIETACAETLLGTYPDTTPEQYGVGLNQHDEINLIDIQQHARTHHIELIQQHFGYDILQVKLAQLADDPLLSTICCRLSYLRIAEPIPDTLGGRAYYWKTYYNTYHPNAAGTVQGYIDKVRHCLGQEYV